jgi:pilus assembly protein Flp/PilA
MALRNFCRDESGATAIEYGLVAALVGLATVAAFTSIGLSMTTVIKATGQALDNASLPLPETAIRSY